MLTIKTTNASRINNDDAWRDVERIENAEEEMGGEGRNVEQTIPNGRE
jgi:hypothetical protein